MTLKNLIYGIAISAVIVGVPWLLYMLRSGRDPGTKIRTRLHRAWRRLVFFVGDLRIIPNVLAKVPLIGRIPLLNRIPGFTWDIHQHQVDYWESMNALSVCRRGDIGLHRDSGYVSNWAIPGFMKHAWIHLDGPVTAAAPGGEEAVDVRNMQIIEAVSEGVLRRSAMFPVRSDYTIILRPKEASPEDVNAAVAKALKIEGCRYDADFKFDIEEELEHFSPEDESPEEIDEDKRELEVIAEGIRAEWDGGFSCTETVSFAWWHRRRQLRLFRRPARGKQVILADQMINDGFEIVWMSDSVTPQIAAKLGLPEEGVELIREYRRAHPVPNLKSEPTADAHKPATRVTDSGRLVLKNRISDYQRTDKHT
ncbi:MAG: hypothetical protein ACYTGB_06315 [Planctomycetota bacterium]|jgi:hypothetical protein